MRAALIAAGALAVVAGGVALVAFRPAADTPSAVVPAMPSTAVPASPSAVVPETTRAVTPVSPPARPQVRRTVITRPDRTVRRDDGPAVVEGLIDRPQGELPDGVPEQVSFFFGGGPECWDTEPDQGPAIRVEDDAVIPSRFLLCFNGFDRARPLRVTMTPPGGPSTTRTLAGEIDDEFGFLTPWPRLPSHRTGPHRITARQGDVEITRTITVTRPDRPRLWVDRPPTFNRATDVDMYYAGFPPNRTVAFNLYRDGRYHTTFRVRADKLGGGHAVLRVTGDHLPTACWGVSHPALGDPIGEEPPYSRNGFCTDSGR